MEPVRNWKKKKKKEIKILGERELSFNSAVLIPARAQSSARILERVSGNHCSIYCDLPLCRHFNISGIP